MTPTGAFPQTINVSGVINGATANTKSDGTGTIGTDLFKAFTAGAQGSLVKRVRFNPVASVAATGLSATVLRLFLSSKTSGATSPGVDTWLVAEIAAAVQTADQTVTATFSLEIPLNLVVPAGYTLLVSSHIINVANTSWHALVEGVDY